MSDDWETPLFDMQNAAWERCGLALPEIVRRLQRSDASAGQGGHSGRFEVRPIPDPTTAHEPSVKPVLRGRRKGKSGNPAKRAAIEAEKRRNGL